MDKRRKRTLYRSCHRGIKEMDLVLGGYGRACISDMSEEELLEFEALLEMNDQELLKMFMTGEGMPLSLLRVREYWEGCGEG